MTTDDSTESVRPSTWPETYSAAGQSVSCPHQMHWDEAACEYRCIHECGTVEQTPPESACDESVVSFKPVTSVSDTTAPNPVEGGMHFEQAYEQPREMLRGIRHGIVDGDLKAADAARLGWVLYFPETIMFETTSDADTDAETGVSVEIPYTDRRESDLVSSTSLGEDVIRLSLRWNVEIPPGTALQANPLFNYRSVEGVSVIPSVVADRIEEGNTGISTDADRFTEIHIYLRVTDDVQVTPQMPCVQLVLRDAVPDKPEFRALSDDELQEVNRQDRAMSIYPDWYETLRDPDRH
jgi:hypothetical protein